MIPPLPPPPHSDPPAPPAARRPAYAFRASLAPAHLPRRPGHTLLELAVALSLMGVAYALALPSARGISDRFAVRGAREAVTSLAVRTRQEARSRGGARLRMDAAKGTAQLLVSGVELDREEVGREFGVTLRLSGGADEAELWFDALGIGRVASLTVELTRGDASAVLVFSAYGRVRRR